MHYRVKSSRNLDLIISLLQFCRQYAMIQLSKFNLHENPNLQITLSRKKEVNTAKLLHINDKYSFKLIKNDAIVPPKSVYKNVLIDFKGHFVKKC